MRFSGLTGIDEMRAHTDKTTLLASDQQRSIVGVLNTDNADPIAYMPFGHHPRESAWFSRLGFNGELPDPLTGHYHLGKGYRQYSPVLMRFIKPDRESPFRAGGFNAYVYCDANPVGRVDPSGRAWKLLKRIRRFFGKKPKGMRKSSSTSVVIADSSSTSVVIADSSPALPPSPKTTTPPPFSSDKTVNDLIPEDYLGDDLNYSMFERRSSSPPASRRSLSTPIDYSEFPPMQAPGQYDALLENARRSASDAPVKELLRNDELVRITPGPSRLAFEVDATHRRIRDAIHTQITERYWEKR